MELAALETRARNAEKQSKRLSEELSELSANKRTSYPSKDLEALRTKNEKLKYQLLHLNKSIERESGGASAGAPQGKATYTLDEDPNHSFSLLRGVCGLVRCAIQNAFPGVKDDPVVKPAKGSKGKPAKGMYQCNAALSLFKPLKETPFAQQSPKAVAEKIIEHLPENSLIDQAEVVGNGFINITIREDFLLRQISSIIKTGFKPPKVKKLKVAVDFSSPNIAKEMHVGHLRSTIIGDCLARVLEFVGHKVDRVNHVGDWGTQFGQLIAHMKDKYPNFETESPAIGDLQAFYKESKIRADGEPGFKKRALEEVVKLQSHDPTVIKAWKLICAESRREFNLIYDRLDVVLKEKGESFYQDKMVTVVDALKEKGLLVDEVVEAGQSGRKVAWPIPGGEFPLIVVKSDGGFTYDTSDLATFHHRVVEEKNDWVLYVVDQGQSSHFKLIFAAAEKMGWYDKTKTRIDHVGFGLVLRIVPNTNPPKKEKFKSRDGESVRLRDLLDEGIQRATSLVRDSLNEEERKKVAEAVAYGCIKYCDLSHNRMHDYVFEFDKMLTMKGNTAAYLLYAFTRVSSILRQDSVVGLDFDNLRKTHEPKFTQPEEWALIKYILQFSEMIESVLADLLPSTICDYLYGLSETFTKFYDKCRVLNKDASGKMQPNIDRLLLCYATKVAMAQCFSLLGIATVDKM